MTISHHPGDETLVRHAAGTLGPGPSVVVQSHVSRCPQCRATVGRFEAVGGLLLEEVSIGEPPADGLARLWASIERESQSSSTLLTPVLGARPALPAGFELPTFLNEYDFGRWRWVAPGIHVSRAAGDWARAADLKLMRVGAGRRLPRHTHAGVEWTSILLGSFGDGLTRYAAGDFSELDQTVDHEPVIDADNECICLVAIEGRLRPHGVVGRLYQMVVGS
jgi:putative transcriptional regulator